MQVLSNPNRPTPDSPPPSEQPRQDARIQFRKSPAVLLQGLALALALVFFALHFLHLSADFPNSSPWMDWSKYTDEGWYGDAAIRHFQLGHWYVPGDFNPAVALPVWPILEAILFEFTGVSLVAARSLGLGVFGAILAASWLLIARSAHPPAQQSIQPRSPGSLTAATAILLLTVSPFCFAFSRLAILEPPLVLFLLLALLTAQSVRLPAGPGTPALLKANAGRIVLLGLLLPIVVLTKTTGVFLVPAVVWMLFAALDYKPLPFLRIGVPLAIIAGGLWLAYFLLIVRPHYLLDYRYLFSANAYTGMTRKNCFSTLWYTINGGIWIGKPLYLTACACVLIAFASLRRLRRYPVIPALLLWAFGYAAFLAYHNNLQPRYYFVIAIPLTLLIPVVFRDLILPRLPWQTARLIAFAAAVCIVCFIVLEEAHQTLHFVRHPEYTFVHAAHQIDTFIHAEDAKDPAHNPLVLSISGSDLSLMTGLHSICDDFGTADLVDRVHQYNPGWYVAWNLIEDDKMDSLTPQFHVTRVATFPAMDDQDRNLLIVYRLDPATAPSPHPRPRRRSRVKIGQQPSPEQLEH